MRNDKGQFIKGHTFGTNFVYNWDDLGKDYLRLKSMQKVADYIGCSLTVVFYHFKQQGLTILPYKANCGSFEKGMTPWNKGTKGKMNIWNKGIPCPEHIKKQISKKLTGRKMPEEQVAKLRTYTGDKRYNWSGGCRNYYGDNWLVNRAKALERDNFVCQSCGVAKDKMRRTPDVHHIIAFKNFINYTEANHISNLVTLCQKCHHKAEVYQKGKFIKWVTNSASEAINLLNLKQGSKLYEILSI